MLIKDLIEQLQVLYEAEMVHADVIGDPEIMIDCFRKVEQGVFHYAGFNNRIKIERSADGVYPIISGFLDD